MEAGIGLSIGMAIGISKAPFTPTVMSSLTLWLKADPTWCFSDAGGTVPCGNGDLIRVWKDRSGNAYDVSQATSGSRATLVLDELGRWCARFAGGQEYALSASLSVVRTAFSLYVRARQSPAFDVSAAYSLFALGNSEEMLYWSSGVTTVYDAIRNLNDVTKNWARGYPATYATVSGASAVAIYGDGDSYSTTASAAATLTGGFIGSLGGGDFLLQGDIYEIILCNVAHDTIQRDQTLSYLASSTADRVLTDRPLVVIEGDSRNYGFSATSRVTALETRLTTSLGATATVRVQAVPGSTEATVASRAARIDRLFLAGRGDILAVLVGTNSLGVGYTTLRDYLIARRAAGWKTVVCTELPRSDQPTDAWRITYDASILADAVSIADAVARPDLDLTIGPIAAASDASLYPDGLHLSSLGFASYEPILRSAVQGLLP